MSAQEAVAGSPGPGRRPRRRWLFWSVGTALVLVLAFFGGGGWYFSSQIRSDALVVNETAPPDYEYQVLEVSETSVRLATPEDPPEDLVSNELLGLVWEGGYGQVGVVIGRDEASVTRRFIPITGTPSTGTLVALDPFAFPNDPAAVGVEWNTVTYESGLGPAAAWFVDGTRSTWAIFVHGRGANPDEALRALPLFAAADFPSLLITYRNDEGAPEVEGRLARFGATEWEDLEGAVRYAIEQGADDVVLVGYSMGGAIVASFLLRSELAPDVEAAILEAPALDLGDMIDARAGDTQLPLIPVRVPIVLTAAAKRIASWRFEVNFGALDYVSQADRFVTPMLIIHGTADDTVPIAVSEDFAGGSPPGLVTLVPFEGAGHVRAWNVNGERYESVVGAFLTTIQGVAV